MRFLIFVWFFLALAGCTINYPVRLGEDRVIIQQTIGKGKTYIHLHHNEKTALKAAKIVINKEGGSLITLIHSGARNIVFHLNNQRYEFDPNRIYTDKGIKKTLSEFSQYTPDAHREVKKLANKIKELLPEGKIVAVHNNATYSFKDYLPGHKLAHDAKALHVNPDNYFRNFYLVTNISDYARLKTQGFNEVLQNQSASDDGSLSIFLAKKEYINVEAGYDQLLAQIKMLQHA